MPANTNRTAKKTTPARGDKPAPVGFNFDTWHRDQAVEPFVIVIDGNRYESLDPLDIDFRVLNTVLDQPEALFRELFPDDADEILANKIAVGALGKFSQAIATHFGLEDFVGALS